MFKTVKISELTGAALDWAVAQIESGAGTDKAEKQWRYFGRVFHPSTDWAQGGPIIERAGMYISIQNDDHGNRYSGTARWWAQMDCRVHTAYGPTPLVAAMRCYVAGKLGDSVEVPEELLKD
jgi:hypothetical protein